MKKIAFVICFFFLLFANAQTDFEIAETFFKEEKWIQAEFFFQKSMQKNPSNLKTIEYLGDIASHNKNWKKAISFYKTLKQQKPNQYIYWYKYGGASAMYAIESNKFIALSMAAEIRAAFEKTLTLNPNHIESRWALIEWYLQMPVLFGGSETKALKYAQELSNLSVVDGCMAKARIAEYYKKYTQAELQYKEAIKIGNSKKSYEKLANLYKNKLKNTEKEQEILNEYKKYKN